MRCRIGSFAFFSLVGLFVNLISPSVQDLVLSKCAKLIFPHPCFTRCLKELFLRYNIGIGKQSNIKEIYMAIIKCPSCRRDVSSSAKACPNCGEPIDKTLRCPRCGSTDVKEISTGSKIAHAAAFGIFALKKLTNDYECKKCKFKFS